MATGKKQKLNKGRKGNHGHPMSAVATLTCPFYLEGKMEGKIRQYVAGLQKSVQYNMDTQHMTAKVALLATIGNRVHDDIRKALETILSDDDTLDIVLDKLAGHMIATMPVEAK